MRKSLRLKTFALIQIIALVLSASSIYVSYSLYENTTNATYGDNALRLASTINLSLDREAVKEVVTQTRRIYEEACEETRGVPTADMPEAAQETYLARFEAVPQMPAFVALQESLMALGHVNKVRYVTFCLWDIERGNCVYVIDGSTLADGSLNEEELTPAGWVEPLEAQNAQKLRAGNYDIPAYITNYPEYGWLCTGVSAILDEEGRPLGAVYVDVSMDEVKSASVRYGLLNAAFLLGVAILLDLIALYFLDRIVITPIQRLTQAAESFVNDHSSFANLPARDDEIGQLTTSLQQMEQEIVHYIRDITHITAEKERVDSELNIARQIQADMLPSIFPAFPNIHMFDIYATMTPAKEVGGDFYDFFLVDDDHLAMVMADVSGKGVPAALFMVIARTIIKNRTLSGGSPAEILHDVNNMLCEGNKSQLFVTVWLAILDLKTGKGVAANAGHENPILRRAGGNFELVVYKHSPALAAMEDLRFREHEFEMYPGDTLYVYTDGVPEATAADGTLFGTDRLLGVLNDHCGAPLGQILQAVKTEIDRFVGSAPQFDDITMLALDYHGNKQEVAP